LHLVRAGGQVREQVHAVGVGLYGFDELAVAIENIYGDAGEARLIDVLNAVAIEVMPHEVAEDDRGRLGQAAVGGQVDVAAARV